MKVNLCCQSASDSLVVEHGEHGGVGVRSDRASALREVGTGGFGVNTDVIGIGENEEETVADFIEEA